MQTYFIMFRVIGTLTQNSEVPLNCTAHCLTRNLQVEFDADVEVEVRVRVEVKITRSENEMCEKKRRKQSI